MLIGVLGEFGFVHSYVRSSGRARCPDRKAGFTAFVVLEVLLVVIKRGASVRLAGTKLYTPGLKRRHREERLRASMLSRN
jgi:hypothetical protein